MLEFAAANDICLFTLPSHTTHYLQTLDRSVFKSLKAYYYEACRMWLKRNPGRRLTRLQFEGLLSEAWGKGATYENAVAGFKATGIYPFNRSAVPDYAFASTDANIQNDENQPDRSSRDLSKNCSQPRYRSPLQEVEQSDLNSGLETAREDIGTERRGSSPSLLETEHAYLRDSRTPSLPDMDEINQPGPSKIRLEEDEETPSKFLNVISPIPVKTYQVRKRAKQVATILTSEEHIAHRKECDEKKNKTLAKPEIKKDKNKTNEMSAQKKTNEWKRSKPEYLEKEKMQVKKIKKEKATQKHTKKKAKERKESTETEDDEEPILLESGDSSLVESLVDDCVGCGDNYYTTDLTEDWIQCIICKRWAHENCTEYDDKCHPCGNRIKIDARKGKGTGKKTKNVN